MPQRFRATVVAFVMVGYAIGTSAGGLFAAWLVPHYGWQVLFYIGGLAPLALLPFLFLALPESIKYLLLSGKNPSVPRLAKTLDPLVQITDQTRFVLEGADGQTKMASWKDSAIGLFRGQLYRVTPVLWIAMIASSTISFGGSFGGLFAGWLIDRLGVAFMAPIPLIAAVVVVTIGAIEFSDMGFLAMLCAIGFFVFGGHFGLLGVMGMFYPSANRANGVGWALSVGKLGSIFGPTVAAILIAGHASLSQLLMVAAAPLPIVAMGGFALGRLRNTRSRPVAVPLSTGDLVAEMSAVRLGD